MARKQGKTLELTPLAVLIGVLVGVVMTAANVYLGLYAGMTVSASIPASVIAAGIFRGLLKQQSLHQCNIIQTMASAGESLAAGVIFTLPALVLVGAWQDFQFIPTTVIAISGGLLGVIFMIPLRRTLIIEDKDLKYPEGVACAEVLKSSSSKDAKGLGIILQGLGLGALFKFLAQGLKMIAPAVETGFFWGKKVLFFGMDMSPALLGVGYIVGLEVAILVFIGGSLGWFLVLPMLSLSPELMSLSPIEAAETLWATKIRYLGVGAMIVGGVYSIISVRQGMVHSLRDLKKSYHQGGSSSTSVDMSLTSMGLILVLCLGTMMWLYHQLLGHLGLSLFTAGIMILATFPFVAVSSYIVGLVGSSNNPVSGITIAVLLATSALFLTLGLEGDSGVLATLGVASVVCCAACTAGDCSQDLKTGSIIGASPRAQQWAQVIGVLVPAFVIAPVLSVLHHAEGIGRGLMAPQATLFANISKAMFKGGEGIPYDMVVWGVALGLVVLILDHFLKKKQASFRLYVMPLAVGIYLPITLAVPLFIGGVLKYFITRAHGQGGSAAQDQGVLLSSGLIAGEAILGVVLAVFVYNKVDLGLSLWSLHSVGASLLSLACFFGVVFYLGKISRRRS